MIKMFATDIDNTLFSHKTMSIPERNVEAADELRRRNVELVIATARIYAGIRKIADRMKMKEHGGWAICSAGSEIINCGSGERTVLFSIPMEVVRRLKAFADRYEHIVFSAQQQDLMVADGFDASLEFDRTVCGIDFLVAESDFFSFIRTPVCIAALTGEPSELDEIEKIARKELSGVNLVRSDSRFLDIVPEGVSKAAALQWLCEYKGLSVNEMAAMGDGNNDVEMLQESGLSFAPANAIERVRMMADHTVGACELGGFADAAEIILQRNRYQSIKKLAIVSAELLEQVQFEDHQGKAEKTEPLLEEIVQLACDISQDPEKLLNSEKRRR